MGFARDPRSSGGTVAVLLSESKLIRGSRVREERSRLSSSATRRSTASVLAAASSSRATASAARRSFSACRSRRSRSFWAAAHSRYEYELPDEPEPRAIAHLLTASNGLPLESNSREHWRQCVHGSSRGLAVHSRPRAYGLLCPKNHQFAASTYFLFLLFTEPFLPSSPGRCQQSCSACPHHDPKPRRPLH